MLKISNEVVTDLLQKSPPCEVIAQGEEVLVSRAMRMSFHPNKPNDVQRVLEAYATDIKATVLITFHIKAVNRQSEESIKANLHLVDLISADVCKESKDPTLEALSDVLTAVGYKQSFVPYKNCKLTHILQNGLNADGKALMVRM